jgi:hypothetical protein
MKDEDRLENPQNVLFADLLKVCRKYFGKPRIRGSHYIFKNALERRSEDKPAKGG